MRGFQLREEAEAEDAARAQGSTEGDRALVMDQLCSMFSTMVGIATTTLALRAQWFLIATSSPVDLTIARHTVADIPFPHSSTSSYPDAVVGYSFRWV